MDVIPRLWRIPDWVKVQDGRRVGYLGLGPREAWVTRKRRWDWCWGAGRGRTRGPDLAVGHVWGRSGREGVTWPGARVVGGVGRAGGEGGRGGGRPDPGRGVVPLPLCSRRPPRRGPARARVWHGEPAGRGKKARPGPPRRRGASVGLFLAPAGRPGGECPGAAAGEWTRAGAGRARPEPRGRARHARAAGATQAGSQERTRADRAAGAGRRASGWAVPECLGRPSPYPAWPGPSLPLPPSLPPSRSPPPRLSSPPRNGCTGLQGPSRSTSRAVEGSHDSRITTLEHPETAERSR